MNHVKAIQGERESIGLVEFERIMRLRIYINPNDLESSPVIADCCSSSYAPQNKSSNFGLFFGIWHHLLSVFPSPAIERNDSPFSSIIISPLLSLLTMAGLAFGGGGISFPFIKTI